MSTTPVSRTRLAPEPAEKVFRRLGWLVVNVFTRLTKQDWRGMEHVPGTGGVLIVGNHTSEADPLVLGHFLISAAGRWPRYLGKAEIWGWPVIGWLARKCGQIKVERNSSHARDVVGAAAAAIDEGKCVVMYPEGGVTRDPDLWPMEPRTGAARIALETGCPVVPVAQWGAHTFLAPFTYKFRPFPRKTFHVVAGPAIDLSDYADREVTGELLDEISELMMARVTELLVQLRGGTPPTVRYRWTKRGAQAEKETPHDAH